LLSTDEMETIKTCGHCKACPFYAYPFLLTFYRVLISIVATTNSIIWPLEKSIFSSCAHCILPQKHSQSLKWETRNTKIPEEDFWRTGLLFPTGLICFRISSRSRWIKEAFSLFPFSWRCVEVKTKLYACSELKSIWM